MPYEITLRYGAAVAASGRLEGGVSRLDLALSPLPAPRVAGTLEVRAVDEDPPASASASCISEWLKLGEAAVQGNTVTVPLEIDPSTLFGSPDRPHESTVFLTVGATLIRVAARIPTLVPAGAPTSTPADPGRGAPVELRPAPAPPTEALSGDEPFLPPLQPRVEPPASPQPSPGDLAPPQTLPPSAPPAAAEVQPPPGVAPPAAAPPQAFPPPLGSAPPPFSAGGPMPPPLAGVPGAPPPLAPAPGGFTGTAVGTGAPVLAPGVCRNHPGVPTGQTCSWCRNPFCDQCLVDLRGSPLCAWCKQAALVHMQRPVNTVDPKSVVMWARIYDIIMCVGVLAVLAWQGFYWSTGQGFGVFGPNNFWFWLGLMGPAAGLLMALPPAIGLGPGRRWAYVWQMIMLIPSMLVACLWSSCFGFIFWPAAIVLLVYWTKPEVKLYCEGSPAA